MRLQSLPFFDIEFPLNNDYEMKHLTKFVTEELRPQWNQNNISFDIFTAGTTNKVFCVVYKPEQDSNDEERMIFRVYGNNTDKIIDRKGELENWLRLTAVDCAAPLYATFQNGMVCGYLPGKSLTVESLRNQDIFPKICLAMARIHQIKPDRPCKPSLFKQVEKFMDNFSERFPNADLQKRFDAFAKKRALNLRSDYARLKLYIKSCDNDITFCHNDLLVHNIVHDAATGKVSFIDYEYADFNYQCFDIANHFNEYAGIDNVDYSLCPDVEEKSQWITIYLRFYLGREPLDLEVQQTLRQIPIFEAASHFLWSIWALVQSQNSTIDFDYLGYAITRYEMFQERMNVHNSLYAATENSRPVIETHDECDLVISVH